MLSLNRCVTVVPHNGSGEQTLPAMRALILPAVPPWSSIIFWTFGLANNCSVSFAMSLTLAVLYNKHYNVFFLPLCGFGIVLSLSLSHNWLTISTECAPFCILLIITVSSLFLPTPFLFLTFLLIYLFFLSSKLKQVYKLSLLCLFLILQLFLLSWAALTNE